MGTIKTSCCFCALTAIVWLLVPALVAADDLGILNIEPPTGFDSEEINYAELARRNFSLIGTVDAIYERHVVVNDHACPLSVSADTVGISEGMFVGVKLNGDGKAVAIKKLDPSTFQKR